ncbi:hypothetical protein J1614_010395 [Plenodomus biglobosus]|nr:hypothetical protein J1614_010395 [Plenodomus biglobosus]
MFSHSWIQGAGMKAFAQFIVVAALAKTVNLRSNVGLRSLGPKAKEMNTATTISHRYTYRLTGVEGEISYASVHDTVSLPVRRRRIVSKG